jgi:glycosyltransferase involved in cell wall biosynthesis
LVDLALKYRDDKENIIKLWNSQDPIDLSYINKNEIIKKYNLKNKKVILFNHRLLKSKRPFLFFEFVDKILSKREDIVIVVISTIKEKDVYKKFQILLDKYQNNILWIGNETRLNFQEMKEIFSISDVGVNIATLVCPSLATLEAMAAGIPQVISNELDSDAYVVDGYNGFVLNKLDADELLNKVEGILDDELRDKFSLNCQKHVVDNFSQEEWSNKMMEVYNK